MTPSHSNKRGVRYRYYVSHSLLQQRKVDAGSVGRVSAPDIEIAVVRALREHLGNASKDQDTASIPKDDRELIERYVQRVTIKPNTIEICGIRPATAVGQESKRQAR